MHIVIEISDELYKALLNGYEEPYSRQFSDCIRNGMPLPKGHGDLVDRDALESTTIVTDDFSSNEVLDVVLVEDLRTASTIVEADKEGENGD